MYFLHTFDKMILTKRNCLFLLALMLIANGFAAPPKVYSKYDYLHGKLNKNRSWFDVTMYDIHLKLEPSKKFISGSNAIMYKVLKPNKIMQLDLHGLMQIDSIVYNNKRLSYKRDSSVILVNMPSQKKDVLNKVIVYFSGYPLIAKKAPWDGGFVFAKDSNQRDWVGLACEGLGASVWLPCKDHLSDEADSMNMQLDVPTGLVGVSNGKLVNTQQLDNGFTRYAWQVRSPINNYNITVNAGYYKLITDEYKARHTPDLTEPLSLNYYVLDYNYLKAKKHFVQVKPMLDCYERYFGAYPFWNDGYKLVETPYWGMEHQSCVAYGNDYTNTRWDFDFIIVHESAHEWFGNSLSCNDPAELWLHESFTTYAESVFIECLQGKEPALKYLKMQKRNIENKQPLLRERDVYFKAFGDNDIYFKGSWMLHTIRHVIDNDTLWFNSLRDYALTFKHKNLTTAQCIQFFEQRTRKPLAKIFEHYTTQAQLPVLEYSIRESDNGMLELRYRWVDVVSGFEMPIEVTWTKDEFQRLMPLKSWRVLDLNYSNKKDFKVRTDHYLIETREVKWE
jgi:aminopeptidase N